MSAPVLKRILVAIGFGLLYAYDVWEAVSTLVELPRFYEAIGLPAAFVPWWLLVAGVALPPVVYALALLLGRKLSLGRFALILLVGLAVVAALSLGAVALEFVLRPPVFTL
jgi:hypothetical protein